jgi:hypothetical protein
LTLFRKIESMDSDWSLNHKITMIKKHPFLRQYILVIVALLLLPASSDAKTRLSGRKTLDNFVYVTTADQSQLFERIPLALNPQQELPPATIRIDSSTLFQEMDGLGACQSGGFLPMGLT